MPELTKDTRVLKDPVTGELIAVPAADADKRAAADGLSYATLPEITDYNEREKFGSAGEVATGALELAGESATLGLYAPDSADAARRRKLLRRDHPGIALAAEAAGAIPAIAASEATGGLAAAAGLSARLGAAASVVAEGGVSGFAQEQVQAREDGRDIDAGNIFLYGIGGEIAGRVVPKAIGAGLGAIAGRLERRGAAGAADALSGEADNLLVRAEQRASQGAATDIPSGPQRDLHLRDNAQTYIDTATKDATEALDRAQENFSAIADSRTKASKIRKLVSKEHIGQDEWQVQQVDELGKLDAALEGGVEEPSIASQSHADLGADTFRPEDLDRLRADPDFAATGQPGQGIGRTSQGNAIRLERREDGSLFLNDGSHRLQVAREKGLTHLPGEIYDAAGTLEYSGPVRVSGEATARGTNYAEEAGLKGAVKQLKKVISDGEDALLKAKTAADKFIAGNHIKQNLDTLHVRLGSNTQIIDKQYRDELMSMIRVKSDGLRASLENESLWGRAARFQADVNSAWHNRWFDGIQVTEQDLARITGRDYDAKRITEFDPSKVRGFLQKDKIGRGLTEDKLKAVLDGYQEMAEANRKWGMADDKQLKALQADVDKVRSAISTADEVNQAIPRAAKLDEADRATEQLIGAVPVVGPALVASRRALRNIQTAGQGHIARSADILVNGLRRGQAAFDGLGNKLAPVATAAVADAAHTPVEDRFKGTYPTLTQSFLAKRESVVTAMQDPGQLANAMADSLGDLADVAPDLHLRLVMRMSEAMNYLSQHMPPGVENSLLAKHANPPDVQSIKQFARLWEAVMDPGAVVQDFATMHATPAQARAIEAVHPDIYTRLQGDAIKAIAESPVRPPYERLRYLNQIFKLGPALGGVWKPSVAKNIKNSMANAPANPEGLSSDKLQTGPTNPRGIASIAAGPTSSA